MKNTVPNIYEQRVWHAETTLAAAEHVFHFWFSLIKFWFELFGLFYQ